MLASLLINSSHSCVMQMHWALMLYISEWKLSMRTAYLKLLYDLSRLVSVQMPYILCHAMPALCCATRCIMHVLLYDFFNSACSYVTETSKYTLNSYLRTLPFIILVFCEQNDALCISLDTWKLFKWDSYDGIIMYQLKIEMLRTMFCVEKLAPWKIWIPHLAFGYWHKSKSCP